MITVYKGKNYAVVELKYVRPGGLVIQSSVSSDLIKLVKEFDRYEEQNPGSSAVSAFGYRWLKGADVFGAGYNYALVRVSHLFTDCTIPENEFGPEVP
jgi:hypothetical protein